MLCTLPTSVRAERDPNLPEGCIARFQLEGYTFTSLTIDKIGNSVSAFCGTATGEVIEFDCANGRHLSTFNRSESVEPAGIQSIAVTPTQILATSPTTVMRWSRDSEIPETIASIESPNTLDPSGVFVASPRDSSPIWISSLPQPQHSWRGDHQVQSDLLRFSPDSRWLLSTRFGRLYCWRVSTGELVWKRRLASRATGLEFSPSHRELIVATEYGIGYRLNIIDGETISELGKERQFHSSPALAWSLDESLLIVTEPDNTLAIVEEFSHLVALRLKGHRDKVTGIRFLPDSQKFVSVDASGVGLVWDLFDSSLASHTPPQSSDSDVDDQLVMLWQHLSEIDSPRNVWTAVVTLRNQPEVAYAMIRNPPDGRSTLTRLISELDHREYLVRAAATRSLRKFGVLAEPALRQAKQQKQSVEMQRRLNRLLILLGNSRSQDAIRKKQADDLRLMRCVHLLTWIHTERSAEELAHLWEQADNRRVRDEIAKVLERTMRNLVFHRSRLTTWKQMLIRHHRVLRVIF